MEQCAPTSVSPPAKSVLITDQLQTRPFRARDDRAINQALTALAQTMANAPDTILQKLVEVGMELCHAQSAGVSLLTEVEGKPAFRWYAVAGEYAPFFWGTLPRDFSPCGTVLDTNAIQLMCHPERHFNYLADVKPNCAEVLLVPFSVKQKAVGTIWIVAHDDTRRFDGRDAEIMSTLGEFAAAAYTIVSTVSDLQTSRVALERANVTLKRANEDLETFAFAASHDLQEPLRSVSMFLQLLQRRSGASLGKQSEEFVQQAIAGVERMGTILRDVLTYSHLEREDIPASVNLQEVLDEAVTNLEALIRDNDAVITSRGLPVVHAIPTQLSLLFQNLISNAIRYRRPEESPRVEVSARKDGDFWEIAVRDNGQGFSQEFAAEVFKPFKRLHGRDIPGTGLGLAISTKIIEHHGGAMWVKSDPASGSTFYFTIRAGNRAGAASDPDFHRTRQ